MDDPPYIVDGTVNCRPKNLFADIPKLSIPTPLEPLESFTLFPGLPIEIRIKTWKLLSFEPRKVKLFFEKPLVAGQKSRLIDGQTKIPSVLHICKESRAEGLRYYTLCKDQVLGERGAPNHVYVNFEADHFSHAFTAGRAGGSVFNFGLEVLKQIRFVDAYLYSGSAKFSYFALGRYLMVAENLVDFRFVITGDDYQLAFWADRGRGYHLHGHLTLLVWMKELLDYIGDFATDVAGCGARGAQHRGKTHWTISTVYAEGPSRTAIWD